jgi:hypothetical protein
LEALEHALYRHPAFLPHRLLNAMGVARFWVQNTLLTTFAVVAVTACAGIDRAFIITNGYGYVQHPGVFGWYLVQFIMPAAIYRTLRKATRSETHYRQVIVDSKAFQFKDRVLKPMVNFIGLATPASRSLFALLFLIGFSAFSWNTFQNLYPGKLAPLDFWDSIHYKFGYFGSRAYKFYLDALLLPSVVHVFAGIVWTNVSQLGILTRQGRIRLAPFDPDRCGGFGFLADLILSPSVSALLVSGLAFFGVAYTHRAFDISTVTGILVQLAILVVFYAIPTFLLRSVLRQVKKTARIEVHLQQEVYYQAILAGGLQGVALRDAHEYLRYFNDISGTIDKIPDWPHIARVTRALGISLSPALISSLLSMASTLKKVYSNLL